MTALTVVDKSCWPRKSVLIGTSVMGTSVFGTLLNIWYTKIVLATLGAYRVSTWHCFWGFEVFHPEDMAIKCVCWIQEYWHSNVDGVLTDTLSSLPACQLNSFALSAHRKPTNSHTSDCLVMRKANHSLVSCFAREFYPLSFENVVCCCKMGL